MDLSDHLEQSLRHRFISGVSAQRFAAHATPAGEWRQLPFLALVLALDADYCFTLKQGPTRLHAQPGEIVLVPAETPHRIDFPRPGRLSAVHIQFELLGAIDPLAQITVPGHLSRRQARPIAALLPELIACHRQPVRDLDAVLARRTLPLTLLRLLLQQAPDGIDLPALRENHARLRPALDHLHAHLDSALARDDLAALVHLSPSRFTSVFRSLMGMPPMAYVQSIRLRHAASLLRNTDMSIGSIAEAIGSCDQFHFSRRFKQRYGLSPSTFRQSLTEAALQTGTST